MAYDDDLQIYAGIDQSGVTEGMNDMEENVRRGLDAVNSTAESKMGNFSGFFVAAANAAGQAIYGIADKAKDSFVSMLSSGDDYNKAMNQLAASTGATGEELEGLKDVAKGVFANNYGESYDDVANAVANVKKQLGDLPADELQTITESAFALSDTFEYDVAETTRAAKAMVDNFGISGERAMELIAAGAQNNLNYSDELIDSINEYSVQFAKVGLSADDMFKILQSGEQSGAWNLDKIGDAVKEFSLRAIDGSTTTAEGFAAIGMNADEMAWKFAQGGDAAKQAFQETVSALTSMEDPLARDAAGVALFGPMWEDLGVDAVASLGNIQDGAYATGDAMKTIKEVKYNDIGSAIEGLKRSVGSFTIDARAAFSTGIAGAIGTLVNALNSADGDISVIFDGIVNALKQAGSAFLGVAGGWIENGKKVIEYLVNGIKNNMPKIQEKAGEILEFLITGFLNGRKKMLEVALPIIQGLVQGLSQALPELLSTGFEIIQSVQEGVNQTLPELISQGIGILQSLITGIVNAIPQLLPLAINIITALVNGLTQAIVAILQFAPQILTTIITGIISVLPTLIECAVQILNVLISAITDNLPLIISAAIEILMALLTGIIDNIMVIVSAAMEILNALISAIIENLPLIISAAIEMLMELFDGIVNNLPLLIDAAIEIVMAITNGLIDNLERLMDAAFQIIQFLIDELLKDDNLQKILDSVVEIVMAVADGIIGNLDKLIDAAFQIIDKIASELLQEDNIDKLINTGIELLEKIIKGLCEFAGRLAEFAGKLFVTLGEELAKIDWSELGKDVLEGIMSGLTGVDFNVDEFTDDFGENWVSGFKDIVSAGKDFFDIGSPSKLMRDEIGQWLLPGIAVGVKDTSDETADDINNSIENLSEQLETPEITETEFDMSERDIPEQSEIEMDSPEISISEPEIPEPEFELPEFSEKQLIISSPEVRIDAPEKIEFSQPEIAVMQFNVTENPEEITPPEVHVSEPEPIEFDNPEIEPPEIPKLPEIEVSPPEISVSEPEPIQPETPDFDELTAEEPDTEMFTQQIELLREFSPVNSVPKLDDERITTEIQSQLDEIMVTLNADSFISRFEAILSGIGNVSVPQYSEVYGQVQTVSEKTENNNSELSKNIQLSPKISVFIGDTEIKDFVISTIDEANAVSGGVSV